MDRKEVVWYVERGQDLEGILWRIQQVDSQGLAVRFHERDLLYWYTIWYTRRWAGALRAKP